MDNCSGYVNFLSLHHLWRSRTSLFAFFSFLLFLLSAYNGFSIFCFYVPFLARTAAEAANLSTKSVSEEPKVAFSKPSSTSFSSDVVNAVKEQTLASLPKTHLPNLRKPHKLLNFINNSLVNPPKSKRKPRSLPQILRIEARATHFATRVKLGFHKIPSNSTCKVRFFMTWISALDLFGDREMFAIESLFKAHPNGCLVIISNSMDSSRGRKILGPFQYKGFRVTAVSPDFNYLFKNTAAQAWFDRLIRGKVNTGLVSLGQNLSNLLRLALLYKFGGIYIDTDVIVLKSFAKLRNAIGAQTMNTETKNWSRLNNAVLIFDKGHPLLYNFIEEFAHTFDGNKWGYNGPYLVSRVVSRVSGSPGYNFTVLPPMAFYPVDWSRIRSLFQGPKNDTHFQWMLLKYQKIWSQSFTVHLWNSKSRELKVEEGSIIERIMSGCCVFCNSFASML